MADNENLGAPQSRNEALLQNILGANYDLGEPQSRNEALLMKIAGEDVDVDFEPQSRIEALLMEIIDQGGGGGVEVEPLSVTENGTYTAPQGVGYSPVTVNVGGRSQLPSEYQEVEYIDGSASGAVINTGLRPNDELACQLKIKPSATTSDALFGTKGSGDDSCWRFFNHFERFYWDCGNSYGNRMYFGSFKNGYIYEVTVGNRYVISSDGQESSASAVVFQEIPYDIFINGASQSVTAQARWYYIKFFTEAQTLRDFVPCYRKADDVVGLYDLVTNSFYTSVGSGQFTAGPDVISDAEALSIVLGGAS